MCDVTLWRIHLLGIVSQECTMKRLAEKVNEIIICFTVNLIMFRSWISNLPFSNLGQSKELQIPHRVRGHCSFPYQFPNVHNDIFGYMQFFRRLDSFMDSQFTFDQSPNNPPTSWLFGSNFMSTKLYQLSPLEVRYRVYTFL